MGMRVSRLSSLAQDEGSHPRTAIEKDLQAGMTVVADRYAFSGIAFSAAKVC
jgi:thymidylate kinase